MKRLFLSILLIGFSFTALQAATYRDFISDIRTSPTSLRIVADSDTESGETVVGRLRWADGSGGFHRTEFHDFSVIGPTINGTSWKYDFTDLPVNTTFELELGNRSLSGEIYGHTGFFNQPIQPIKLATFGVVENSSGEALLSWRSISECNGSHYEIQRSINGSDFEPIDQIPTAGGGQSCIGASYEYTDNIILEDVFAKEVFYRLKMVGLDDEFDYSDLRNIDAKTAEFIFFNMNNREVLIENMPGEFMLTISNQNGQIVLQQQTTNGTMSLQQLPKGIYFITVEKEGAIRTEKIVIQ